MHPVPVCVLPRLTHSLTLGPAGEDYDDEEDNGDDEEDYGDDRAPLQAAAEPAARGWIPKRCCNKVSHAPRAQRSATYPRSPPPRERMSTADTFRARGPWSAFTTGLQLCTCMWCVLMYPQVHRHAVDVASRAIMARAPVRCCVKSSVSTAGSSHPRCSTCLFYHACMCALNAARQDPLRAVRVRGGRGGAAVNASCRQVLKACSVPAAHAQPFMALTDTAR